MDEPTTKPKPWEVSPGVPRLHHWANVADPLDRCTRCGKTRASGPGHCLVAALEEDVQEARLAVWHRTSGPASEAVEAIGALIAAVTRDVTARLAGSIEPHALTDEGLRLMLVGGKQLGTDWYREHMALRAALAASRAEVERVGAMQRETEEELAKVTLECDAARSDVLRLQGESAETVALVQRLRDLYFNDGACHGEDCPAACGEPEDCDCEEAEPVKAADAWLAARKSSK